MRNKNLDNLKLLKNIPDLKLEVRPLKENEKMPDLFENANNLSLQHAQVEIFPPLSFFTLSSGSGGDVKYPYGCRGIPGFKPALWRKLCPTKP